MYKKSFLLRNLHCEPHSYSYRVLFLLLQEFKIWNCYFYYLNVQCLSFSSPKEILHNHQCSLISFPFSPHTHTSEWNCCKGCSKGRKIPPSFTNISLQRVCGWHEHQLLSDSGSLITKGSKKSNCYHVSMTRITSSKILHLMLIILPIKST